MTYRIIANGNFRDKFRRIHITETEYSINLIYWQKMAGQKIDKGYMEKSICNFVKTERISVIYE